MGIKYFYGDFRKTKFPSSSFDVFLSNHTINEVPDPQRAFKEFRRLLKKNGLLVCLFLHPCFDFIFEKMKTNTFSSAYFQRGKITHGRFLVGGVRSEAPYFNLHLPLSEWSKLLKKNGFYISTIEEPHPSLKLLEKDKWWKESFNRPRFILIEAKKI